MTQRQIAPSPRHDQPAAAATAEPSPATETIDPRAFGLVKAAYSVLETLDVLSIGRTSLYEAIGRGELSPVKFGRKTLFYAVDLAVFLSKLKAQSASGQRMAVRVQRR